MGSRLRALREENRLSYQDLANDLLSKYGIKISKDSLRDYEISSDFRSKAKSLPNLGMRTEYLFVLADFYGVSTDWLLGISNVMSPNANVKAVCDYTGLSERSVYGLNRRHTEFTQKTAEEVHWPDELSFFIDALFEYHGRYARRFREHLKNAATLAISNTRYWSNRIKGFTSLSGRERKIAILNYERRVFPHKKRDYFEDFVGDTVNNSTNTIAAPISVVEQIYFDKAEGAIQNAVYHAYQRYVAELEKQIFHTEGIEEIISTNRATAHDADAPGTAEGQ